MSVSYVLCVEILKKNICIFITEPVAKLVKYTYRIVGFAFKTSFVEFRKNLQSKICFSIISTLVCLRTSFRFDWKGQMIFGCGGHLILITAVGAKPT